jgi:large subunit ribosomal protein L19
MTRMAIRTLVQQVEQTSLKDEKPQFEIGDTVDVHCRILEGDKERIQIYSGIVIAMRGEGMGETFTVRRIVDGEGVERIFPVHSPKIAAVEVKRRAVVRRAKLYYLRDRIGKQAFRLKERVVTEKTTKGRSRTRIKARRAKKEEAAAAPAEAAKEKKAKKPKARKASAKKGE